MSYLTRKNKSKEPLKLSNQRTKPLGCLDETTNQRLNAMYQKFISKNRQCNPLLKAKASEESSNMNMRSELSPTDDDAFFNKCQISIDKDISIEGIRVRFEDVIESALEGYEAATQQYLNFIYEKFSKAVSRLSRMEGLVSALEAKLTVSNLKNQENTILRQLNKELESKIISLEGQVSSFKASRELSGLRQTLERARQNNSMKERNPTPKKDSRFDIEKKLLLKENLELKKELENIKKQHQLRLEQILLLKEKNDESLTDNARVEGYQQILIHAQNLENRVESLEFEIQRKSKLIHDLQEEIKSLSDKPREENEGFRLKYEVAKADLESKTLSWTKRLETRDNELADLRTKMVVFQQESLQIKKENIKKEAREVNNLREIEQMKGEIEVFKRQIQKGKKTEREGKREENNDIDLDELKVECEKLRLENARLLAVVANLNSRPNEADSLRTENTVLKQVMKSEKDKSIPKSSIIEAVKKIINIEPPKLKESPELNGLLTELYQELERTREEILEHELELKELRLHKNKLDHILHEEDEGNDFETTQVDAYFFRSKPQTDAALKQELKKLATKLDYQLSANIEANKQIKSNKGKIRTLQQNERKITEHLRGIVDEEIEVKRREQHLTGLLEWSGLEQLTSLYHDKLFC